MAKETMKKIGVPAFIIVFVLGSLGTIFFAGGKVAAVEKDIVSNTEDVAEVKEDVKLLKGEVNEAKLRDERMAGTYSRIEAHMLTESKKTDTLVRDISKQNEVQQQIRIDLTKIQGDVNNLQKVE